MNCFRFITAPLHTHAKNTWVNNKWPLASAPADSIWLSIIAPPLCAWNDSFTLFMDFLETRKQVLALCSLLWGSFQPSLIFSLLSSKRAPRTSSTTSSHAAHTYRPPRVSRSNRFHIVTADWRDKARWTAPSWRPFVFASFLKWRVAVFRFLLSPHYDTLLLSIDCGPYYLHLSYLITGVHSFTSSAGGGETNQDIMWVKKNSFFFFFFKSFLEIAGSLENKDWSWSCQRGVGEVRAEL